jgi:hypothetical protein
MKKQYRRVGSKSKVLIVRVSKAMEMDLNDISEKMEMSISDFVRVAIRNAITYYAKKGIALAVNNAELEQWQRDFNYSLGKKEQPPAETTPIQFIADVPTDEEIQALLQRKKEKVDKAILEIERKLKMPPL